MDLKSALTNIVSTEQVQVFSDIYDEIVNDPAGLTKDELCKQAFGINDDYFSGRIFDLFDTDHSSRVDKDQFILGMSQMVSKDEEEFVDFLFDVFDADGSGEISEEELVQGMLASMRANKLSVAHRLEDFFDGGYVKHKQQDHERAVQLAKQIFQAVGHGNELGITRQEFKKVYLQHMTEWNESATPLTKARIATRKYQQYIAKNGPDKDAVDILFNQRWKSFARRFQQNRQRILWITVWLLANIGLFLWKFLVYRFERPVIFDLFEYCISFARGSAEALKLNIALALFTMARGALTWLRNANHGAVLNVINLDDNVAAHKLIGLSVLFWTLIHVGAHACDFHVLGDTPATVINEVLGTSFTETTKYREVDYWFLTWPGLTGTLMLLCMFIAYPPIFDFLRKRNHFNLFWGTHQALIVFSVLVMIHGTQSILEPFTAVYYVGPPFLLYVLDRVKRTALFLKTHNTGVTEVRWLPPNVIEITMNKGAVHGLKAGQYVFLNVPRISLFEWHPFTLTSAPDDDFLRVHIRSVGQWTRALHEDFRECQRVAKQTEGAIDYPKIYIDGPYGAPSQGYERYKVCVFIAAGIGATPYAAILSEIVKRVKIIRQESGLRNVHEMMALRKVYFIWTTRDEESLEWFDQILQDVHDLDVQELIEVHHYYTSAYEKGDFRNALIGLAQVSHMQDLMAVDDDVEQPKSTSISKKGAFATNRARYFSHYGRPKWDVVFDGIKHACEGMDNRCGVFATVPPRLSSILSKSCRDSSDRKFKFNYTAENF